MRAERAESWTGARYDGGPGVRWREMGAEVERGCRHADDAGERGDWAGLIGRRLRVRLSSCLCAESSISCMLVGSKPDVDCLKEKATFPSSPCRSALPAWLRCVVLLTLPALRESSEPFRGSIVALASSCAPLVPTALLMPLAVRLVEWPRHVPGAQPSHGEPR